MMTQIRPPETLLDLLAQWAEQSPEKCAYTFLVDGDIEEVSMTYRELDLRARTIAVHLQTMTAPGERALLLYPSGLDYITAFFGCLYAGVVAVPCYPPRRNRSDLRIQTIATDAQAALILTNTRIFSERAAHTDRNPVLQRIPWLATDQWVENLDNQLIARHITSEALAFLQYTSGSTSVPKGVMVTHGNLMANEAMIQQAFGHTQHTIFASWLPLFHDMGLVGNVLQPFYLGIPCFLMSPEAFLPKPVCWLQAMTRYNATTSGAPNFAYDLCAQKISDEQRATLDLRSWEVAFTGSEPIRADTLERFTQTFAPCGFRREAFYPCYGMAETTLFISGGIHTDAPVLYKSEEKIFGYSAQPGGEQMRDFSGTVGCGRLWNDEQIVIVEPETLTRHPECREGEIWVSGSHIARGYWNRPEESDLTFNAYLADTGEGPFLRTGDLGFLKDGELFVTGRLKDLIIIRGQNYYPQDIEYTVEQCHPDLRQGSGAAFSVERTGAEELVLVYEIKRTALRRLDTANVIEAIRQAVAEQYDIQVDAVSLLKPGGTPKTTSGKVQRSLCRKQFLEDCLESIAQWRLPVVEISHFDGDRPIETSKETGQTTALPDAETLRNWLLENISRRTGLNAEEIDTKKPLVLYGVDSATALALSGELAEWLNRQFPPTLAYDYPSIDALANYIATELDTVSSISEEASSVLAETERTPGHPFPLSYGQRALWLFHQEMPFSSAYNVGEALRISSPLDIEVLQKSVRLILNRHPMLRSTFSLQDGEPLQIIQDKQDFAVEHIDASGMTESRLRAHAHELLLRPFDLKQGPVCRVSLLAHADDDHILLLAMHHLVIDAWSLEILLTEILSAYQTITAGSTPVLTDIQRDYQDFVRWQTQMIADEQGERLWHYWQQQLSGDLPGLYLPTDRTYPDRQSSERGNVCIPPLRGSHQTTQSIRTRPWHNTIYGTSGCISGLTAPVQRTA